MPNPYIDGFLKKIMPGKMSKTESANEIVRSHVLWSVGAGLVPVPVLDIAAVTAVQLDMINQICKIYDLDFSESVGKSLISALAGSTLARIGSSFVKAVPVVGPLLGGVSMSVLSGATTYAVGQVFISHFEKGGTLNNFSVNNWRSVYEKYFEEGKKVASEMKEKKSDDSQDAFESLEKLQKLREKEIITEEEFQAKKAEILAKL